MQLPGEGNGNPLQYSCLENPRNRGTQWAAVYGVAQSQTRLKRLSKILLHTSLLELLLFCLIVLEHCVFIFNCVEVVFQILSLISSRNHLLFNSVLFRPQDYGFSSCFWLYSCFILLWSDKIVDTLLVFLNILRIVLWSCILFIVENVPWALEKNMYCILFE